MATKKQKHERAMAKREKWLAERRESGLKAQREDKARREAKARQAIQSEHDKKKHSSKKIDKNCIICQEQFIMEERGVDIGG